MNPGLFQIWVVMFAENIPHFDIKNTLSAHFDLHFIGFKVPYLVRSFEVNSYSVEHLPCGWAVGQNGPLVEIHFNKTIS